MKKNINYIILFLLAVVFILIFKYSVLVKTSIISSIELWINSLIPAMLPIYIIIDLLINYGLLEFIQKIFKSSSILLVIIALLAGTPTNAKYIKEFYESGYISKDTGNFLLLFAYSPGPLFILTISPNFQTAASILGPIYLTNAFIFLLFKPKFHLSSIPTKPTKQESFINCLSTSIAKSTNILILILGIVIVYGILTTFLTVFHVDSLFISSILELTNALVSIAKEGFPLPWAAFACLWGGLSIHTQIKSILEGTELSYRYFLTGRLIASIPVLIFACLY